MSFRNVYLQSSFSARLATVLFASNFRHPYSPLIFRQGRKSRDWKWNIVIWNAKRGAFASVKMDVIMRQKTVQAR